jgi:hypothetical protein
VQDGSFQVRRPSEENFKGTNLVEYLTTYFEILNQFKTVNIRIPTMTYATCIDLDILIKEMMDYDTPSDFALER